MRVTANGDLAASAAQQFNRDADNAIEALALSLEIKIVDGVVAAAFGGLSGLSHTVPPSAYFAVQYWGGELMLNGDAGPYAAGS